MQGFCMSTTKAFLALTVFHRQHGIWGNLVMRCLDWHRDGDGEAKCAAQRKSWDYCNAILPTDRQGEGARLYA